MILGSTVQCENGEAKLIYDMLNAHPEIDGIFVRDDSAGLHFMLQGKSESLFRKI